MFKEKVIDRISQEFGVPARKTVKIVAWEVGSNLCIVVQTDQPNKENYAFVWLPYPPDSQPIPEIALEYAAESGRHSNTYKSSGLERGKPALKLIVTSLQELEDLISYIKAFKSFTHLPELKSNPEADKCASLITESELTKSC